MFFGETLQFLWHGVFLPAFLFAKSAAARCYIKVYSKISFYMFLQCFVLLDQVFFFLEMQHALGMVLLPAIFTLGFFMEKTLEKK